MSLCSQHCPLSTLGVRATRITCKHHRHCLSSGQTHPLVSSLKLTPLSLTVTSKDSHQSAALFQCSSISILHPTPGLTARVVSLSGEHVATAFLQPCRGLVPGILARSSHANPGHCGSPGPPPATATDLPTRHTPPHSFFCNLEQVQPVQCKPCLLGATVSAITSQVSLPPVETGLPQTTPAPPITSVASPAPRTAPGPPGERLAHSLTGTRVGDTLIFTAPAVFSHVGAAWLYFLSIK